MIWRSLYPNVIIPENKTVTDFVFSHLDENANRTALIDGPTGKQLTYTELYDCVKRFGNGLLRAGFQPGNVMCVFSPNSIEYAIAFFGVTALGGTLTTVNPAYTKYELLHQLRDSDATYLLTVPQLLEKAQQAVSEYGRIKKMYVAGEAPGYTTFDQLLNSPNNQTNQQAINSKEDVAAILYSSGTTGLPKGVMLTHYNIVANVMQCTPIVKEYNRVSKDDYCYLLVLPMYHSFGVHVLVNQLYSGNKLVLLPYFEPDLFLGSIQKYKVTSAYLVPPLVLFLAKHPVVTKYDLSSLIEVYSGAAPLGLELQNETTHRLKLERLVQGYGLTETSPGVTGQPFVGWKMGSSGQLIANTEAKIVDVATGKDLGLEEDGEIWVRGPQVMKGYLNNPEATAHCIDTNNWFHTGDIGHFDSEQHLYVVDRLKELIKCKGFQVAPAELEGLLLTHHSVADVGVVGIPDERSGEVPKAFIVLKPHETKGAKMTKNITDFVKERVASYKYLSGGIEFVDEIPKSPSGKILRRLLRDMGKKSAKAKL